MKKQIKESKMQNKKQEEKEKRKKILIILIIIFLFFIFMIDVKDIILDIPTKPTITKKVGNNNEGWTNGSIIQIKKDAKSRSGVKYYLYCVNKERNSNSCEWKKAQSKNIEVKNNGTNYVFIKGVNENGKEGKVSDPIEVKNDKQEPLIIKVKKDAT